MPNIYFAPPARPDPYAFANRDAMMQIFDAIGKSKKENFNTEVLKRYLADPEQGFSSLMAQEEPEGFLGRMWDVVNPKGTYRGGVSGLDPFAQRVLGQAMAPMLRDPLETEAMRADIDFTKARTKYYGQDRPATLSPIMKMVKEGLITQAEGRKLARKDADDDLGEKDIISIMHTIERALEATYDAIGSPIPGREDQRKYYIEQLEQYKSRLDEYRSARRGETESYYSPSNPPLENLPLGTLEVNRTAPIAPRPYLNSYWRNLDDDTKSLVTRAITQGATQIEILEALRARGAIK